MAVYSYEDEHGRPLFEVVRFAPKGFAQRLPDGSWGLKVPKPLSSSSINMTIRRLAAVLEQAVEYGYIDRNPARGSKRLLRRPKPSRSYLQPDRVSALLTAAGMLDSARAGDTGRRRPLLATLTLAGLRISEGLDLRWRDVNLPGRRIRFVRAKTDAGVREIDVTPTLAELLAEYRTRTRHGNPDDLVFPTATGKRDNRATSVTATWPTPSRSPTASWPRSVANR